MAARLSMLRRSLMTGTMPATFQLCMRRWRLGTAVLGCRLPGRNVVGRRMTHSRRLGTPCSSSSQEPRRLQRFRVFRFACLLVSFLFAGRELCKCYWCVRWIVLPDAMHRCLLSALHASLLLRFLPESGCSLASILLDAGCFHGDPHPGNVLVRRRADAVPAGQSPFQAAGRMQ